MIKLITVGYALVVGSEVFQKYQICAQIENSPHNIFYSDYHPTRGSCSRFCCKFSFFYPTKPPFNQLILGFWA